MPYMSPIYTILYGMLSRAALERLFIHYLQGFIADVYVRLFISCDILSRSNADQERDTWMHGETEKDEGISKKREAAGVYYNSLLIRDQKYHLSTLSYRLFPLIRYLPKKQEPPYTSPIQHIPSTLLHLLYCIYTENIFVFQILEDPPVCF